MAKTTYTILPATLKSLRKLQAERGQTFAQLIEQGVTLLEEHPELLTSYPEDPYGSGKQPKVFNLPDELRERIAALSGPASYSRVVSVAVFALADYGEDRANRAPKWLLRLVPDAELRAELHRRKKEGITVR